MTPDFDSPVQPDELDPAVDALIGVLGDFTESFAALQEEIQTLKDEVQELKETLAELNRRDIAAVDAPATSEREQAYRNAFDRQDLRAMLSVRADELGLTQ